MRRKILILAFAVAVAATIILAAILPWTTTLWTPVYMLGIQTSSGFVGRGEIIWSTVIFVAGSAVLSILLGLAYIVCGIDSGNKERRGFMKKLLIFVLALVAFTAVAEIILPQIITQTYSPICSLPGVTVTSPHWLLERWIPRYNVGLTIALGVIMAYTLLRRRKLVS